MDIKENIGSLLSFGRTYIKEDLGDYDQAAYISSNKSARDTAIIETEGWIYDNYKNNPVVFYNHSTNGGWAHEGKPTDYLPIAKSSVPQNEDDGLISAVATFDKSDPEAMRVHSKVRDGYINSTSVQWNPLEWEVKEFYDELLEKDVDKVVFTKQELLEWSFVGIPADYRALVMRSNGQTFDLDTLADLSKENKNNTLDRIGISKSKIESYLKSEYDIDLKEIKIFMEQFRNKENDAEITSALGELTSTIKEISDINSSMDIQIEKSVRKFFRG